MGFDERVEIGSVTAQDDCSELGGRECGKINGEEVTHTDSKRKRWVGFEKR